MISKPVNVVENKTESTKKCPIECDMGYDIIEDIKKTKATISLFEMCNLPQQRINLLEAFDPKPGRSQDDIQLYKEINEANIGPEV